MCIHFPDLQQLFQMQISPGDMDSMGIEPGADVVVRSRRGVVTLAARRSVEIPEGLVCMPFCYAEAAANLLTNPALDPYGKIPELKFAAVRVEPSTN